MVVEGWSFLNLNPPTHQLRDVLHIPNERRVALAHCLSLGTVLGMGDARLRVDEVVERRVVVAVWFYLEDVVRA